MAGVRFCAAERVQLAADQHPLTERELRLCRSCLRRVSRQLRALPALFQECEYALVARPRGGYKFERVGGRRRAGIELSENAVNVRKRIRDVLSSWANLVVEECSVSFERQLTIQNLVDFLVRNLEWLATHSAAGDFVAEIDDLVADARRAAEANPAQRIELGNCLEQDCHGTLIARMRSRDDLLPSEIRCEAGHTWPAHQWLLLGRRMTQAVAT